MLIGMTSDSPVCATYRYWFLCTPLSLLAAPESVSVETRLSLTTLVSIAASAIAFLVLAVEGYLVAAHHLSLIAPHCVIITVQLAQSGR